jgi:iron complex transport system ATP-binding protein
MLKLEQVSYCIGQKSLVHDVSFEASAGEFVVIMGMNGAGKSTLLKLISSALKPTNGNVLFHNKSIHEYAATVLALQRAVLSQQYHLAFAETAYQVAMMGRYPHFNHVPTAKDKTIVQDCLQALGVQQLQHRNYLSLSGGEAQKIQMARVLAQITDEQNQQPKMLLLDEPVSHLDIKHQHQLLLTAKEQCSKQVLVIAVLHDVNLALKYASRILLMKEGNMVHELQHKQNLTPATLKEVFEVEAQILFNKNEEPFVVFN